MEAKSNKGNTRLPKRALKYAVMAENVPRTVGKRNSGDSKFLSPNDGKLVKVM